MDNMKIKCKGCGKMKNLALILWILAGFIGISFAQMSQAEWNQNKNNCFDNENSTACQALIDNGLKSVAQCDKSNCDFIGVIYQNAGLIQDAIKYYEKALAFGDYKAAHSFGILYGKEGNFTDSFKYMSMACEKISAKDKGLKGVACFNLGNHYHYGKGTRQDYFKAVQYYKKACDLGDARVQ